MKKKKILKFLTLFLSFTGVAFTFSFSTNIKLEKNILINDELKDEKIIERKIVKYSPLNVGNEIDDEITNINEVKLLLNYEVEDFETINENKKFFTNKNNEFINLIKEKINYIKDSKISELSPIVWFYFENKNDKDKFLNFIKNDNSIFKIINFTYEAKPTVFIDDKNCPDKKCIEKFREAFLNFDSKTEKKLDIVYRYPVSFTKNNLNIINAEGLYLSDNENNKIGILEAGNGIIYKKLDKNYFNKSYVIDDNSNKIDYHAGVVAKIAAGKNGVDKNGIIVSVGFKKSDSEWQKKIEKLVIDYNVKVINHSYGSTKHISNNPSYKYNENAYFLDYISKKYGIINVFSAGNDHENPEGNKYINSEKLSFNSIVVGALSELSNKNYFNIAYYSNRTLENEYIDLPKPLVVAPSQFEYYDRKSVSISNQGTSFAAPLVSGAINALLKEKPWINVKESRVSAIKAILAASAKTKKDDSNYKPNGLSSVYGSGLIDYKKMKIAADNLKIISAGREKQGEYVFESNNLYLTRGENIKIASAWMNNGGILRDKENRPILNYNWWDFLNPIAIATKTLANTPGEIKWNLEHNNEEWLKKGETEKRQNNKFFTDFDLYFEKWNGYSWEAIKSVTVVNSNVEVIDYDINESGKYRIRVKKYSNIFENSINDVLAVTYVKN